MWYELVPADSVNLKLKGMKLGPVYQRMYLGARAQIAGPALIQEHGTTTVLFAGDSCTVAASGELILTVGGCN